MHHLVEALGTTTAQEQGALQGCPRLQPYLAALAFSVRSPPHPAPPRIQTLPPPAAQNSLGVFRVHYFTQPCKKTSPLSPPQQNESRLARRAPGPAELSRPSFCWAGAEEAPGLAGLRAHSARTCSRSRGVRRKGRRRRRRAGPGSTRGTCARGIIFKLVLKP